MTVERRPGIVRRAEFGFGSCARLARIVGELPPGPIVLLGSRSLDKSQRENLEQVGGVHFDLHLTTHPGEEGRDRSQLRAELARVKASVVVACGGGAVMDAAKAVSRPGPPALVLVPVTLSGSEHTANTAYWEAGEKRVAVVGYADAVIADPDMIVRVRRILDPGALHAIAHALATLSISTSGWLNRSMAKAALTDLISALEAEESSPHVRLRYLRGAWMAAIGFAVTGPKIGKHHRLVHRYARPREHALFSARLLCSALLNSDWYSVPLKELAQSSSRLDVSLRRIAERWLPTVASVGLRDDRDGGVTANDWGHEELMEILA